MAQQRLKVAAEEGDIDGLYSCIQEDPHILDLIDKIPFVDTPLHAATSAGHDHFALEILRLKPSFGQKLNPDGLSPLDLALRNEKYGTVRRLIKFDEELIRVKGRESLTPLHYVAETNQIDLLAEFLCACPASIEDKTIRAETALHIAVKNFKPEAFKVLLGWLRRRTYRHQVKKMLNLKDDEGNNVLHIAVSTSQPQIVKLLVGTCMNKKAKNWEDLTALDIAAKLSPEQVKIKIKNILRSAGVSKSSSLFNNNNNVYSLADFLMSPHRSWEVAVGRILQAKRRLSLGKPYLNMVLVVAVLIATATYQAVLSPPGGGVIDHNKAANNLLPTKVTIMSTTTNLPVPGGGGGSHIINATISTIASSTPDIIPFVGNYFYLIYSLNTLTFLCSIIVIMAVLHLRPFGYLLQTALLCLTFSYASSFHFISPSQSYAISLLVVSLVLCLIPYCVSHALWVFQRERLEKLRAVVS